MKDTVSMRMWIGLGVIAASIAAGGWAFYYYAGAIQVEADQIVALKSAGVSRDSQIANLASLKNDAPKAATYQAVMQKLLPDQAGLITFNSWASGIAAKYGVSVTITYVGDPTLPAASMPGSANFTMTVQGPSKSIAPFLDEMTTKAAGFIVSFTSFSYSNSGNQETLTAHGISYFR